MSGINQISLLGHVGADPIVRQLDGGVTVANLQLAVSEAFRDKKTNEKSERTEWFSCVFWRGVAESVSNSQLKKGDRVFLNGKLRNKKWKDKDGNEKTGCEIVVDTFTIISRKKVATPETTPTIAEEDF